MFHRLFCFGMLQLLIVCNVQAQDSKPQITISKETTYITTPLRPDGRVDYVEVLSQIQPEGVTPENNSVVMFRRALGHRDLKPEIADEYFRQLGMEGSAKGIRMLHGRTFRAFIVLPVYWRRDQRAYRCL